MLLFNTANRKKEFFKPLLKNKVGIYTCGPTVYDYAHIGNLRSFVFADILQRYLRWQGFKVIWVMNLTDIDDKTIKGAQKKFKKKSISLEDLKKYTDCYKKSFFEDIKKLNIQKADFYPEATHFIKEMIELVKILLNKGYAYKAKDGSIYFKISQFKNYGKFAHIDVFADKKTRILKDSYEKEEMADFVLWKAKKEGEPFWKTEIGEGRPGWHLECSVMSKKFLGQPFDIHTGGVDLIFPHHQNEIAQSEAVFEKPLANFWLHNEHLLVEGQKMAKSLGNFYTLSNIEKKGFSPLALRYLYLTSHYRDKLNFTSKSLLSAQNTLKNLENFIFVLKNADFREGKIEKQTEKIILKTKDNFKKSMDDDLNTPSALASIFNGIKEINKKIAKGKFTQKEAKITLDLILDLDKVFALNLEKVEKISLPLKIIKLIDEREKARKAKNFQKADTLRKKINQQGFLLEDTPYGPRWRKNNNEKRKNLYPFF